MKRGEIWTVAGGPDYAGKPRPVVIVQNDAVETISLIVVPFTTDKTDAPLIRRRVEPTPVNSLSQPSQLMMDKLTAVPKAKLGQRIGTLEPEHMTWIGQAVIVILGLAG